jgi:hypothetical protein
MYSVVERRVWLKREVSGLNPGLHKCSYISSKNYTSVVEGLVMVSVGCDIFFFFFCDFKSFFYFFIFRNRFVGRVINFLG